MYLKRVTESDSSLTDCRQITESCYRPQPNTGLLELFKHPDTTRIPQALQTDKCLGASYRHLKKAIVFPIYIIIYFFVKAVDGDVIG